MQNQSLLKKIIFILILIVIAIGIFFGYNFYQNSKKTLNQTNTTNTDPNRTPFQTRVATGSDIIITDDTSTTTEAINPNTTENVPVAAPKLVQLWKEPVSGFDFITKDIEILPATSTSIVATTSVNKKTTPKNILKNQTFVYLWDRSTGNIYQNLASSTDTERLSILTSPSVEKADFIDDSTILTSELGGNNEDVINSYIKLYKENATSTVFSGTKKRLAISTNNISVLPSLKKMFYLIKGTGQGFISNIDLSSTLRVINTSLTEWIPQYVNKSTVAITTKPSAYFKGYLFFVNSSGTQDNQYILGDKYAFTTLVSPDGKKVLYNEISDNLLQTSIYDVKSKRITALTQATLSEKCVWADDSSKIYCAIPQQLLLAPYPDAWYQGSTSFSDNIWSINPETGQFTVEIALQDQLTTPIDAYHLKISKDKKYLLFQDKYNLTLWKYTF